MSSIPSTGLELLNVVYDHTAQQEIKQNIRDKTECLYSSMSGNIISTIEIEKQVSELINVFNRYTHRDFKDLKLEDKLYLSYAFRDIMDDVKMNMQAIVDRQKKENSFSSCPALDLAISVCQIVRIRSPEEVVIDKINEFERSIEHDIKFKSMEEKVLKRFIRAQEGNLMSEFLGIQTRMEKAHDLKLIAGFDPGYFDIERDVFNPISNLFRNKFTEGKDGVVELLTNPFSPDVIFNKQSYSDLLIKSTVKAADEVSPVLAKALELFGGLAVLQTIGKRLADNMGVAIQEKNMARLTIALNDSLSKVFTVLGRIGPEGTKADFIQQLGIVGSSGRYPDYDKYVSKIHHSCIRNLSRLIIIQQKKGENDLVNVMSNAGIKIGNASLEKTLTSIVSSVFTSDDLKKLLKDLPLFKANDPMLKALGIENQYEKINANRDVILLHVLNTFVLEIENIVSEGRRAERKGLSTDVSKMTDEQAVESVKDSSYGLIDSITALSTKNKGDEDYIKSLCTSFFRRGVSEMLKQLMNTQGSAGLLDASSSVYYQFIEKWQDWLKES